MRLLIMTTLGLAACGSSSDTAPRAADLRAQQMVVGTVTHDDDGDGYCENGARNTADPLVPGPCSGTPVPADQDCDDSRPDVNPGRDEVCDGVDHDCDGDTQNGLTRIDYWIDLDGDGFGLGPDTRTADISDCRSPVPNHATNADDCDDRPVIGVDINPDADEACDSTDHDCDGETDNGLPQNDFWVDLDGDTYGTGAKVTTCRDTLAGHAPRDGDCDDDPATGAAVNPAATEVCDDKDNDCNDGIDEGLTTTAYLDVDGDTFGGEGTAPIEVCTVGLGLSINDDDCDDGDVLVNPDRPDLCNEIDDDCNGEVDENLPTRPYYVDADLDGYGTPTDTAPVFSCLGTIDRRAPNNTDCDDDNRFANPGSFETGICDGVDNDCNGIADDVYDNDRDGVSLCGPDGDLSTLADNDCADFDDARYPGNIEICDQKDNDCDGDIDEGEAAPTLWYLDGDTDGFGSTTSVTRCEAPVGYVSNANDCDDNLFQIKPGAAEIIADGIDQDCDALDLCYRDSDGDGVGSSTTTTAPIGCLPVDGASSRSDDCDDDSATRYPGNGEICDGIDNDCNNVVDDPSQVTFTTYYLDQDADGFGDATDTLAACGATPPGYAANNTDCDDDVTSGPGVFPGAAEIVANGIDEDCDTFDDCYEDLDGDSYGSSVIRPGDDLVCDGPNEANDATDCDDADPNAFPAAPFYPDCDGDGFASSTLISACTRAEADNLTGCGAPLGGYVFEAPEEPDCDDTDAEELPGQQWFADCDADGVVRLEPIDTCTVEEANAQSPCLDTLPPDTWTHQIPAEADCDDESDVRSPALVESCEPLGQIQIDNDCDGDVNGAGPLGGDPLNASPFNQDFDLDGFGNPDVFVMACESAPGLVANDADCDDVDPTVYLGADEICDGRDQNCNLLVDEADFLAAENSFCLNLYRDRDGDGYGDEAATQCLCADIGNGDVVVRYDNEDYVATFSDCDDVHQDIKPHGCNDGVDNDRDGLVDEDDGDCAPVEVDGLMRLPVDEGTGQRPGEFVVEELDGHDNECDGFVPYIELDCDDDGSLARLPIQPDGPVRSHVDVGLAACSGAPIQVPCWDQTLDLECDTRTGLWVTRWSSSEDGFGGRYSRAFRNLRSTACDDAGDCDDHCADRCPGQQERCDGLDNDCSGISEAADTDGLPASMQGGIVQGTMSVAEIDLDGDGFAACLDTFRAAAPQIAPSLAACTPTVEPDRNSDCDEGCYLTNELGIEQCNGFRDVCSVNAPPEGLDGDGDQHRTCGVGGPIESELTEQFFAVAWVSCATSRDGCEGVTAAPPTGSPPWVPLIPPRPAATTCDAPLVDALEPLLAAVGAPALADLPGPTALARICSPDSGGFCTAMELVNSTGVDSPDHLDLALRAGTVAPDCERFPEQYHSRSVWPADRIVASREIVVEAECLRIYGEPCENVGVTSAPAHQGPPVDIDGLLEQPDLWWQSIGRYQPATTRGALLTCWGDPIQGVGQLEDAVGGDCADDRAEANRGLPEGPDDLLGVYLGDPGDCDRCTDGIDNNCDGRTDCEDPSCAVCFVGEARGCRGTRDPCNADEEGGGCQSSGQGGGAALALVMAIVGLRTRRRAR